MDRLRLPLKEIAHVAFNTSLRFPFTLLSAIVGTTAVWQLMEQNERQVIGKIAMTCGLGLILFFVLELMAERKGNKPAWRWGLVGLGVLLLLTYYVSLPEYPNQKDLIRYLVWMLSLHLVASFAAFLNWRTENGFWQFNKSLFLRLLTAVLYSGVLFFGLALAVLAFDQLFDVNVSEQIYAKLWFFMAGIFNTWFFLAGVPDPTTLEQETSYPRGLKLFTQFVLLPLVTLYLLILYGYMGKILLQWEWPRGWVSYLVLGLSTAGIFSLLLIHPLRHSEGNRWITIYAKWFYRALFPLLVLLLLAIWRRVRDYGITENRYFVLALALWLLVVALYFLFSKQKNIKVIPITLGVLAFVAGVGPWGAFSVSQRSQTARLEQLLSRYGILKNGAITAISAQKPVSATTEFEISSMLDYLGEMHHHELIKPWFAKFKDKPWQGNEGSTYVSQELMSMMNLQYRYYLDNGENDYYSIQIKDTNVYAIQGYDYLILLPDFYRNEEHTWEHTLGKEKMRLVISPKQNTLQFSFEEETLQVSLDSLLQNNQSFKEVPAKDLFFPLQGISIQAALQITNLSAQKENGRYRLANIDGRLLIKFK